MTPPPDYAVEYTRAERVWRVLSWAIAAAMAVGAAQLWFFPWLRDFAADAHCRTVLGMPGHEVLVRGLFVGLPAAVALMLGLTFGRRGLRILAQEQVPPRGEKVFRPTRIRRGGHARLAGYGHLLVVLSAVALALWGSAQAGKLGRTLQPVPDSCIAGTAGS